MPAFVYFNSADVFASRSEAMISYQLCWAPSKDVEGLRECPRHVDAGFTLRLCTHPLPSSHERARQAVDSRLTRLYAITNHGTGPRPAPNCLLGAGWRPIPSRPPRSHAEPDACGAPCLVGRVSARPLPAGECPMAEAEHDGTKPSPASGRGSAGFTSRG
jgi:hypothetical protein